MENPQLKKLLLEIVDNQLSADDPPYVREAYGRLQERGYSSQRAKELIASALVTEIYDILKDGNAFDDRRYRDNIRKLTEGTATLESEDWSDEGECHYPGQEEIIRTIEVITEAYADQLNSEKASQLFLKAWPGIKAFIQANFYIRDPGGNVTKPRMWDLDESTDYMFGFGNLFSDMELELSNAGLYQERLEFCQEMLELFAEDGDSSDDFKSGIGEALDQMGRIRESDAYFQEWMEHEKSVGGVESPGFVSCLNGFLWCLNERAKSDNMETAGAALETARALVEAYIPLDMELNEDNDILFERAIELYELLGDEEKVCLYQDAMETYTDALEKDFWSRMEEVTADFSEYIPMIPVPVDPV